MQAFLYVTLLIKYKIMTAKFYIVQRTYITNNTYPEIFSYYTNAQKCTNTLLT